MSHCGASPPHCRCWRLCRPSPTRTRMRARKCSPPTRPRISWPCAKRPIARLRRGPAFPGRCSTWPSLASSAAMRQARSGPCNSCLRSASSSGSASCPSSSRSRHYRGGTPTLPPSPPCASPSARRKSRGRHDVGDFIPEGIVVDPGRAQCVAWQHPLRNDPARGRGRRYHRGARPALERIRHAAARGQALVRELGRRAVRRARYGRTRAAADCFQWL